MTDERWLTTKARRQMLEEADTAEVDWLFEHSEAADDLIAKYRNMLKRLTDSDSQCDVCEGPENGMHKPACALYELLTLRPAFEDSDRHRLIKKVTEADPPRPSKRAPRIPRDLETIVMKTIARDPGHRYQSAAQLAEDLRRFVAGEPIHARRSNAWERTVKWARRRPAAAGLIGVSVAALLTVVVGVVWYNARLRDALRNEQQHWMSSLMI